MSQPSNNSVGRNDPCWCGSGVKYKHCHQPIDESRGLQRLEASRQLYVKQWKTNSSSFSEQGCYDWMAAQLDGIKPKRIFDVGCGLGVGLLELCQRFNPERVVSIDENRNCIQSSELLFRSKGFDCDALLRMPSEAPADRVHALTIIPNLIVSGKQIVLIESDLMIDPELEPFLTSQNKFDAVTVWLVGTHFVRDECLNLKDISYKTPGEYRLQVQNRVYVLADKILRTGGVLHVVDRGEPLTEEFLRQDHIRGHCEQAEPTSLKFMSLDWRYYDEPNKGMKMVQTIGLSGRRPNLERLAMVSTLLQKN